MHSNPSSPLFQNSRSTAPCSVQRCWPLLRDQLGRRALRAQVAVVVPGQRALAVPGAQSRIGIEQRAQLDPGHGLHTTAEGEVVLAAADPVRGEVHGLLTGAALPVDRGRRQVLRQPDAERGPPGDVAGLLAGLDRAAADHIVQPLRWQASALDQRAQREREQVGGVPTGEPAAALADRCAHRVHDHRFCPSTTSCGATSPTTRPSPHPISRSESHPPRRNPHPSSVARLIIGRIRADLGARLPGLRPPVSRARPGPREPPRCSTGRWPSSRSGRTPRRGS